MGRPPRSDDREPLTIILPVALKQWLRVQAAQENRNMSDVIADALVDYKRRATTKKKRA